MYLVAWMTREERDFQEPINRSHYAARETLAEAKALYAKVLKRANLYSASIAGVIESTDYEPAKR